MKYFKNSALFLILLISCENIIAANPTCHSKKEINSYKISKPQEGAPLLSYCIDLENSDETISGNIFSGKYFVIERFNSGRAYREQFPLRGRSEQKSCKNSSILSLHCVYRL